MFLDVAYASALFDQTKVVYVMQGFKILVYFAISVITIWEMLPLHGRVWKVHKGISSTMYAVGWGTYTL